MSSTVSVPFKKYFAGNSGNGVTFHWLRCIYEEDFEDAVANAVWIVYRPVMLAASPKTWGEVMPATAQSRTKFEEKMALAKGAPELTRPVPERVIIRFKKTFNLTHEIGQTFDWLIQTYAEHSINLIVHAVRLVYYPVALAGSAESKDEALKQVERSRLVFEDKMLDAIAQTKPDDTVLIANQLDKTFTAPSRERPEKVDPLLSDAFTEQIEKATEESIPELVEDSEDSDEDSGEDFDDDITYDSDPIY